MNCQSVIVMPMTVNSIRQGVVARLLGMCEALVLVESGEITTCPGHAKHGSDATSGGWRWNGGKDHNRKRGDLSVRGRSSRLHKSPKSRPTGVGASIRAKKPGNTGGAKGGRKVEA